MRERAENLFEDESLADREAAVDEVILQAGGDPRTAIWALLVQLAEREAATSLGYRRGRQPVRRLP